ncbi:hypothetical protein [Paraliomyxa miuraensis]|uniref:hypothetical protein n=1 Tax=Paraliomyxa miuraensis TaxID=376150 RepID=UPI00224ECD3B|nr:hypothetical protein [Paraliomyxa miuraensis]MCX4239419.1 hypothetical protein [Paraliomyxa miuraensis]
MKLNKLLPILALSAVTAGVAIPAVSNASPTDDRAVWSFGGLFVEAYTMKASGEMHVTFKDKKGIQFKSWNDKAGKNQCGNKAELYIHPKTPNREDLKKLVVTAGLAQKQLHVWFEPISGQCYIKWMSVKI